MDWFPVLVAPVLVALGGLATWFVQSRIEELRSLERGLHEDRRKVYSDILDPYIRLFANLGDDTAEQAAAQLITTYEYRKTSFELGLLGEDDVVRAYNKLMQHAFETAETNDKDPKVMMRLWGELLVEIRKSVGNKKTKLTGTDMLRGMIRDIDKYLK